MERSRGVGSQGTISVNNANTSRQCPAELRMCRRLLFFPRANYYDTTTTLLEPSPAFRLSPNDRKLV
jgi:hypothetical protein